jgi:ParB-like chromosome segregation protein Spo0J
VKIETWPLSRVFPYEKNARTIPRSAVDSVARSFKEFGCQQPIVVDKNGIIIVGHVRRLAALQLGWTEAPVHVAVKLSVAQIKAYRLMDNRSHEEATWEPELLKAEMLELRSLDLDLGLTGFSSRELDAILRPALEGEDDAPPLPEKAFTQPGDWPVKRRSGGAWLSTSTRSIAT